MTLDKIETMYSTVKAAEMMEVTPYTVRQWIREGKVKAVKVGGRFWRIPESSLLAFANNLYGSDPDE